MSPTPETTAPAVPIRSVDELLDEARRPLRRLTPEAAVAAMEAGALLVDIRPAAQRAGEGEVPGAVVIERNVLEWRLDPQSPNRIAEVTDHDRVVIVLCSEGYSSSLAARDLRNLGYAGATDVIGGFGAWRDAGLTTRGSP